MPFHFVPGLPGVACVNPVSPRAICCALQLYIESTRSHYSLGTTTFPKRRWGCVARTYLYSSGVAINWLPTTKSVHTHHPLVDVSNVLISFCPLQEHTLTFHDCRVPWLPDSILRHDFATFFLYLPSLLKVRITNTCCPSVCRSYTTVDWLMISSFVNFIATVSKWLVAECTTVAAVTFSLIITVRHTTLFAHCSLFCVALSRVLLNISHLSRSYTFIAYGIV